MAADDSKVKALTPEEYAAEEKVLKQFPFYHGYVARDDLNSLLLKEGDYLLRMSEVEDKKKPGVELEQPKREIILSVHIGQEQANQSTGQSIREELVSMRREVKEHKTGDHKKNLVRNVIVHRVGSKYYVENAVQFDSLAELHQYYTKNYGKLKSAKFTFKRGVELQKWEYRHEQVVLDKLLGEGAFGEVRKGILTKKKDGRQVDVAVKLMKGSANIMHKEKIKEMMNEARLMRNLKHRNVVRIYGVAVDEQPIYIILELVRGGCLHSYLKKNEIGIKEKMLMCQGAAMGVEYMHKNLCMHRDLAARNCLYTDDKIVKISDFGLSKNGSYHVIKTPTKLPIKWLAPDTIKNLAFSLKTDVYSYGIIVYEIFANGEEPWAEYSNADVKKMLREDRFLNVPEECPEKFRNFIKEKVFCPENRRTSMTEVVSFLNGLLATDTERSSLLKTPDNKSSADGKDLKSNRNQKSAYLSAFGTLETSCRKKKRGFHHKKHSENPKSTSSAKQTPTTPQVE